MIAPGLGILPDVYKRQLLIFNFVKHIASSFRMTLIPQGYGCGISHSRIYLISTTHSFLISYRFFFSTVFVLDSPAAAPYLWQGKMCIRDRNYTIRCITECFPDSFSDPLFCSNDTQCFAHHCPKDSCLFFLMLPFQIIHHFPDIIHTQIFPKHLLCRFWQLMGFVYNQCTIDVYKRQLPDLSAVT